MWVVVGVGAGRQSLSRGVWCRLRVMGIQPLSDDLVESVTLAAAAAGVAAADRVAQVLAGRRSVLSMPSDSVRFSRVLVSPDGVPLAVGQVDRVRVTFTNRDAANSVFLHSFGDVEPVLNGVELAASEERIIGTRDEVWASCTVAAASVRVDVTVEAVYPA